MFWREYLKDSNIGEILGPNNTLDDVAFYMYSHASPPKFSFGKVDHSGTSL